MLDTSISSANVNTSVDNSPTASIFKLFNDFFRECFSFTAAFNSTQHFDLNVLTVLSLRPLDLKYLMVAAYLPISCKHFVYLVQ